MANDQSGDNQDSSGQGTVGSRFPENRGITIVPYSATPEFDGSFGPEFLITLTGNVTSSTFTNGVDGVQYTFFIRQDGSGMRTFVWPTLAKGAVAIPMMALANTTTIQAFIYEGSSGKLYAVALGLVNL